MARDNCDEAAARARIDSQMSQEEKVRRATTVIDNDRSEERLKAELHARWREVSRRAERENA